MKVFKILTTTIVSVITLWSLSSCEQDIAVESVVHEDGSIDRTVVFPEADSIIVLENIFGINENSGWKTAVSATENEQSKKRMVTFTKHFSSVDDMNSEMNSSSDTLFKIRSEFEKKFRWFYTYLKYSDTYVAINRFTEVKTEDYFTPEDYSFIQRLPAEGKSISKADSVYLITLNEKIYDHFAIRGLYEDQFRSLLMSLPEGDKKWTDTLIANKERMFHMLVQNKDDTSDDDFISALADSVGIPKSLINREAFNKLNKESERTINFMSSAAEGKYTHSIKMPWSVVDTNADSVAGNQLNWQPPVIKFMLSDYTMYAESRQMNYWAVILSATIVVVTVLAFVRRSRKK